MDRSRVIDLTHPIDAQMPVSVGFPRTMLARYLDQGSGDVATVEVLQMSLHSGTHVDAPFHFLPNAETVDALDPMVLCGPAVLIDVEPTDVWRGVTAAGLADWETNTGERIREGDIVVLRSGHGQYWRALPAGMAYMTHPWPYLEPSAIELLLARRIRALGVECPDPDRVDQRDLGSATFETHKRLLARGIPIIENLAHLEQIPVLRFDLLALSLPVRGASGSPIRALALLPQA